MDNTSNDSGYDFNFDTCMTTGQIGMMKGILPFIDMPMQQYLAIYIKVLELQYVISFFKNNRGGIPAPVCETDNNLISMLQNVRRYSSSKDFEMIDQLMQMMNAFLMYQNYSEVLKPFMETMQTPSDGDDGMASKLQNMLTPEQQAMFKTFMDES